MSYKITNYNLTAERLSLEQTAELPIDADFTVPDYSGEINKIIKCELTPYISSKQISQTSFTAEGEGVITIIYSDQDGNIYSARQEIPFKKLFEASKSIEGGWAEVSTEGVIHSCRAITERRFSIKGSVKLDTSIYVTEKTEIITDIDEDCFEKLEGEALTTTPLGTIQKTVIMEEELTLPQGVADGSRIIRTQSFAHITDCNIITGKVLVKGNLKTELLYCDADNNTQKQSFNNPFNQIIDIEDINEFCHCETAVDVCSVNISPRPLADGNFRAFLLVAKLEIGVSARCDSTVPILYDIYSTKYKASPVIKDVKFSKIIKQVEESFLCTKKIDMPETPLEVVDAWCDLKGINSKYTQNGVTIFGNLTVCILYINSDKEPAFFEKLIDFEYPIATDGDTVSPHCKPEIKITNCSYSVMDKSFDLNVELMIKAKIKDQNSLKLLTEIDISENNLINNDSSIIAYFADKGEKIWEISKSFCANKSKLLEMNNISEEIIESPKMLIIPLL